MIKIDHVMFKKLWGLITV